MKALLILCCLALSSAQFISLQTGNGQAIGLNSVSSTGPLRASSYNPLDKAQHWQLVTYSGTTVWVTSRANPSFVFDVQGNKLVAGATVLAYTKKTPASLNQNFFFNSANGRLVLSSNLNIIVQVNSTGYVVLENKTTQPGFTYLSAPAHYTITVLGGATTMIVTFTNAPASEPTHSWTILAGATFTRTFLAGSILSATDSNGNVLLPASHTVSANATITFTPPPTPSPTPAPSPSPTPLPWCDPDYIGECDGEPICYQTSGCCGGIQPLLANYACCRANDEEEVGTHYVPEEQCCAHKLLVPPNDSCCEYTPYDSTTHYCCFLGALPLEEDCCKYGNPNCGGYEDGGDDW